MVALICLIFYFVSFYSFLSQKISCCDLFIIIIIHNISSQARIETHVHTYMHAHTHTSKERDNELMKEGNVLFNDALNTFYLLLYGVGHMIKDHSESERGNPLPPHGLLFTINNKGSFI